MTDDEAVATHVLTLIQPWAYAVERLGKRIENRGWAPPQWVIGKRIYIHAGAKLDKNSCKSIIATGRWLPETFDQKSIGCSAVVAGFVSPDGRHRGDISDHDARLALANEWYVPGNVAWVLRDVWLVEPRIPTKGQLGLWALNARQVAI